MAEIHVQAIKHRQQGNPSWMWAWLILGILIIAVVVYFVYANKNNNQNNTQEIKNSRNTPQPGAMMLPKSNTTYVMSKTV
jgi:uncharacterized protein HemX